MRFIYYGAGGALVSEYLGLGFWLGVAAGLVLGILLAPRGSSKRVVIEDLATGKIEIQPNDRATQRYIAGRGE